jgi:hypothetical protein
MVWQLYEPVDGDLHKQSDEFQIDLPQDATNQQLLAATQSVGWHSYDDCDGANVWRAVVIEGSINTFVLRWEPTVSPEDQIKRQLHDLEILLKTKLRDHSEEWEDAFEEAQNIILEALKKGTKSVIREENNS